MESGSNYDDLLIRYLLNEASPEEQRLVLDWIKANEKNALDAEELRKVLRLIAIKQGINKIDVDEEWSRLRSEILKKRAPVIHLDDYENSEDKIDAEEKRKHRAKVYKIILSSAVAASVVLLIGFASGWFTNGKQPENTIGRQTKTPKTEDRIDPLMAVVQHEVNTSAKIKRLVLPDGSGIVLYDSSELTYKEPASGNERNVYLVGKAEFNVAKNKAKPFTVFSGDVSTTAVGTVFTVTAKPAEKNIRIRLDEGKVVVKPVRGYNEKWAKELYMTPGQELTYDKSRQTVSVQSSALTKPAPANGAKDNPAIPHYDKRSWFMFNNQSLSGVFDALAEMYDVKILYAKKDVKNMYFIGTYDKSDSLEKILTQIALLNNLKVTRSKEAFTIEKQSAKK